MFGLSSMGAVHTAFALVAVVCGYTMTVGLTLTLFFHMIPGLTETFTRFPMGEPLFTSPEDPMLQKTVGVVLLLFIAVIAWQIRRIWKTQSPLRRRAGVA